MESLVALVKQAATDNDAMERLLSFLSPKIEEMAKFIKRKSQPLEDSIQSIRLGIIEQIRVTDNKEPKKE